MISMLNIKMRSSYKKNNYDKVFQTLCFAYRPRLIVEFGILDGYSLDSFVKNTKDCKIEAYDLFDDFPYNAADRKEMLKKYENNYNVSILKGDFYESLHLFRDDSIDILHIDIANNGDTYEFAIENYLTKVKGIMVLEGGSEERDNVEWMQKYEKPKIQSVLKKYSNDVRITVLEDYPSITLIQK